MNTVTLTTPRLLLASVALVVAGGSGLVIGAAPASATTLCLQHDGKFATCRTATSPSPAPTGHRTVTPAAPKNTAPTTPTTPVTPTPTVRTPSVDAPAQTVQVTSTGIAPVRTVALTGVAVLVGAVLVAEGLVALTLRRRSQSAITATTYSNLQIR